MKKLFGITLSFLLIMSGGLNSKADTQDIANEKVIPYPIEYDITSSGASSYNGLGNHIDSIYFPQLDFYNMESNESLTILNNYKTYQQTTEYTCGPAAALTTLYHYGYTTWDELEIAEIMGTSNMTGTSTGQMVKFFDYIDWEYSSSLTESDENGISFNSPLEMKDWIQTNLENNTPIMVEWIDWMGHWQTIIGYDDMGTEHFGDDVIIFADPYDTSDNLQDGYYIFPAERFYYMWEDKNLLPEDEKLQQWVIAKPKSN